MSECESVFRSHSMLHFFKLFDYIFYLNLRCILKANFKWNSKTEKKMKNKKNPIKRLTARKKSKSYGITENKTVRTKNARSKNKERRRMQSAIWFILTLAYDILIPNSFWWILQSHSVEQLNITHCPFIHILILQKYLNPNKISSK